MMPNVTRGDRMAGLVSYLVGGGRHNEHTEPHLVAGDHALMVWYDDAELSGENAKAIARHLDRPRTAMGVDVNGGHVWHASLSLRAEEGIRTDQEWAAIAQDFVSAMGFDDNDGTKASCRWVAIRHGLSQAGNDHVHIAVNLVREDGTKASTHLDYQRAQNAARALEVKYGLEQLESTKGERATRGYSPAEQARVEERSALMAQRKYEQHAARIGGEQPEWHRLDPKERQARITAEVRLNAPRNDLARSVRAAAGASENEAEFVRRLRRAGVLVRPRFAEGTTDVITGYSVASRPMNGERPIWYGGGQMGRDLTLPRLREGWPDTAVGATDAAAEWQAAKRGRRPVAPGREMREPDPELWQRHTEEVAQLREQLRAVPLDDRDTWSTVARQTAGAFAAWSNAVEETPGDLAEASDALAKSAQTYRRPVKPQRAGRVAMSGATMLLASVARGGQGTAAQLALLRQLMNLSQAVYDAAKAAGEARQAAHVATAVRERVMNVRRQLEATPAAASTSTTAPKVDRSAIVDASVQEALDKIQRAEESRSRTTGSPVPPQVDPARPRTTTKPGADRGPER
ncbi:relaxase/mobilization nuclease domain-containing protein [Microbacterium xanthum]|uniref:relaxase/mobilization nuclease domain-containing protein n=1 Tax=Microbacterium xanthum TaxID=3079794 RepID=UPI002AD3D2F2|nr:relaxase/mobilization nuclease domain-containing protein [Microbacterium sp. KSW-48]MDZ8173234.1 relaxase/mobilization nuclease domain-containing protein [Microbacterium sp. KSW-48]